MLTEIYLLICYWWFISFCIAVAMRFRIRSTLSLLLPKTLPPSWKEAIVLEHTSFTCKEERLETIWMLPHFPILYRLVVVVVYWSDTWVVFCSWGYRWLIIRREDHGEHFWNLSTVLYFLFRRCKELEILLSDDCNGFHDMLADGLIFLLDYHMVSFPVLQMFVGLFLMNQDYKIGLVCLVSCGDKSKWIIKLIVFIGTAAMEAKTLCVCIGYYGICLQVPWPFMHIPWQFSESTQ